MESWRTGKPNGLATKCHINRCVYDSLLEQFVAQALDDSDLVESWVKNDHLGFEVKYLHGGVHRRYIPDFLVRLDPRPHPCTGGQGRPDGDRLLQREIPEGVDRGR